VTGEEEEEGDGEEGGKTEGRGEGDDTSVVELDQKALERCLLLLSSLPSLSRHYQNFPVDLPIAVVR
jgi:hypothetical protein